VHALKTLETEMETISSARDDLTAKLTTTISLLSTTMSNAISLDDKISSLADEMRVQDQKSMDSLIEAKSDSWISPFSAHGRERQRETESS
jgi:ABC-type proline/glycine betaine transport system ATPase subunit